MSLLISLLVIPPNWMLQISLPLILGLESKRGVLRQLAELSSVGDTLDPHEGTVQPLHPVLSTLFPPAELWEHNLDTGLWDAPDVD